MSDVYVCCFLVDLGEKLRKLHLTLTHVLQVLFQADSFFALMYLREVLHCNENPPFSSQVPRW